MENELEKTNPIWKKFALTIDTWFRQMFHTFLPQIAPLKVV